ncbi:unnamed protein product [Urochloa humidicola]
MRWAAAAALPSSGDHTLLHRRPDTCSSPRWRPRPLLLHRWRPHSLLLPRRRPRPLRRRPASPSSETTPSARSPSSSRISIPVEAEQVLYLLNEIQGSYQEEAVEHHQHCNEDSPQEEVVHLGGCIDQIVNCMDVLK